MKGLEMGLGFCFVEYLVFWCWWDVFFFVSGRLGK